MKSKVVVSDSTQELLQDFPLVRSRDPVEARDILRRYGVDMTTSKPSDFFMRTNLAELPHIGLYFLHSSGATRLLIPKREIALVQLCLEGNAQLSSGQHRVELSQGEACICSPGTSAQLEFGRNSRQLLLRLPQRVLERSIASLLGFKPRQPILFDPVIANDQPRYLGFRDLTTLLASRLDAKFSVWPRNVLLHLEQSCITALLYCSRHNLAHLLDTAVNDDVPRYVRTAEHFVDSRCDEDISVEDMARVAGVSISTLTRAFLKHRGYSPSAYVKRAKLQHAKRLLESGAASTLIGVALRCGFANPSRFAQDYRDAFGESPTETLRRCRPGRDPDAQKH
ncbi:AraC family transcriptional regulator [Rhodopseudomonas sp. WA056]|uniref:AraC family transcriptional regulator n=1 Tax=Rhodopseudomonas TaxID=1073 RepID=UPI00115C6898|nr:MULTISPECIES: AraC family transcriptional regulator [Rhodopseudomonas]NEW89987.1 AraC family transcriptional regulator [Rhodopseudomonas sp. WA056]QDL97248.1 AraC family transcriptional regulator [Rhodopseudomonas palustris]